MSTHVDDLGPVTSRLEDSRRRVEHVMGMPVSLALRGRHAHTADGDSAWAEVMEQLHDVDQVFSTYRSDSVISQLGRGELSLADCPAEVREVLALGEQAEQESKGAFSIRRPTSEGKLRLDPSGVVKGWAIERAAVVLHRLDHTDFCLSAGGDMVCHTAGPRSPAWRVGIEHPHNTKRLVAVVPVRNGAVATSGTTHRGQHLVHGRTGKTPQGLASVTVVGSSLTWVDIDATTAYAHGPDAARWLRGRIGQTGLVVWADGRTEIVATKPLQHPRLTPSHSPRS